MSKITAIEGGGDWTDASVQYLVLPDGMDIGTEAMRRDLWLRMLKAPLADGGYSVRFYISLFDWLVERGARIPNDDELTVFSEP